MLWGTMSASDRSDLLQASLRRLCLVMEQVKSCVIVDSDGLLIAACPNNNDVSLPEVAIDSSELGALAARLASVGQRTMDRLAQGKPGRMVLEGEAGTLLAFPVGSVALVVLVQADANLAQALFASQKAALEIESALFPA